jgi:hypothetical protein
MLLTTQHSDCDPFCLQIRMDLKHLKTKNQKAAAKHKSETDNLQVGPHDCTVHVRLPTQASQTQAN